MYDMKYRTVALPEELVDEVEKTRTKAHLGYRSNAEFIADAVRVKIRNEASRIDRSGFEVKNGSF
jgi:metal-responsive CopG/Arc/MetJ family transcriptional regulator